jgi:hypothetical protein
VAAVLQGVGERRAGQARRVAGHGGARTGTGTACRGMR